MVVSYLVYLAVIEYLVVISLVVRQGSMEAMLSMEVMLSMEAMFFMEAMLLWVHLAITFTKHLLHVLFVMRHHVCHMLLNQQQ